MENALNFLFLLLFYYFMSIPNSIKDYVFILQKSILQKSGTEASKIIIQKLFLEKLQSNRF